MTSCTDCYAPAWLPPYKPKEILQSLSSHNASVNSKCQHPPRWKFFKVVKNPAPGQNFLQKHGPRDKKTPTPGEYCERSSQLFLLIGVEILEFCRTLKRNWKAVQVISFSFSLSTIRIKVLKFSASFQTDFVTREQQRDGTSV